VAIPAGFEPATHGVETSYFAALKRSISNTCQRSAGQSGSFSGIQPSLSRRQSKLDAATMCLKLPLSPGLNAFRAIQPCGCQQKKQAVVSGEFDHDGFEPLVCLTRLENYRPQPLAIDINACKLDENQLCGVDPTEISNDERGF
jgi:hypothetical protein